MEVPTQLHYCRWDWCDETFTSAQQHREHIEEHIKRVIPIRRSDVKLVQRAEEHFIQNAMIRTEDSPTKPSCTDAAVMTESFSFQQPPSPHPPATSPPQLVPPVPSLSSEWFTMSNIVPLATSTQLQPDPAQQWEPQSQLPFNLDHSMTSIDSNH